MASKTTLEPEFLAELSKIYVRHGGRCLHFHNKNTTCLPIGRRQEAMSFPVYMYDFQPYFLDERAMIGYFEYEQRREKND